MRYSLVALLMVGMTTTVSAQSTSNSVSTANTASQSGASIVNNAPAVVRSRGSLDTTNSAFAPGLTSAGINSCAGSISAGAAATGFNFGIGSTYELDECTARANAAALAGLGQNLAALESLCQSDKMKRALNASGTVCPSQRAEYIAAQQRSNESGQLYVASELVDPAPAPVYRRRRSSSRVRSAIAAQASNSDASVNQSAGRAR